MRTHVTLETKVFADEELVESGSDTTKESELTVSVPELFAVGVDELKVTTTVTDVEVEQ